MRVTTAERFGEEELTALWNRVYAGYFVPLRLSAEQLVEHMNCGGVDFGQSVVAWEANLPVGLSLLGVREGRGWIAGFGIVEEARGRGLGHRLFAAHLDRLRVAGPTKVQLEVLVQNWALRIYTGAGFKVLRRLSVLRGVPAAGETIGGRVEQDARSLLGHHVRLHAAAPPAWNREVAWLAGALRPGDEALVVGPPDRPQGVAYCRVTTAQVRILDAGAEGESAGALVAALGSIYREREIVVVNEPPGPLLDALLAGGCREVQAQHEMHMSMNAFEHGSGGEGIDAEDFR
jgi:ribosomal protein S18 acetylase RimI-like enzyme